MRDGEKRADERFGAAMRALPRRLTRDGIVRKARQRADILGEDEARVGGAAASAQEALQRFEVDLRSILHDDGEVAAGADRHALPRRHRARRGISKDDRLAEAIDGASEKSRALSQRQVVVAGYDGLQRCAAYASPAQAAPDVCAARRKERISASAYRPRCRGRRDGNSATHGYCVSIDLQSRYARRQSRKLLIHFRLLPLGGPHRC